MRSLATGLLCIVCSAAGSACVEASDVPGHPDGASGDETTTGIQVTGRGEARGTPDVLVIDVGVSVLRDSVSAAMDEARRTAGAVHDALAKGGVVKEDIQTTELSVGPEYDHRESGRHLVGYRVRNVVTARVRDLERAGEIVDAVAKAGDQTAVIESLRFELEDSTKLLEQARAEAWVDAHGRAAQLAKLAQVELGEPVSITESPTGPTPVPMMGRGLEATAAMDVATPIAPGELEVVVVLDVDFEIASPER